MKCFIQFPHKSDFDELLEEDLFRQIKSITTLDVIHQNKYTGEKQ